MRAVSSSDQVLVEYEMECLDVDTVHLDQQVCVLLCLPLDKDTSEEMSEL